MREQNDNGQGKAPRGLPRHSTTILVVAGLVSLLIHVLSAVKLPTGPHSITNPFARKNQEVKIRIVQKPKPAVPESEPKKILETKQEETEAPKEADHLGQVDHIAKKETRLNNKLQREKAADPGKAGALSQNKKEQPTPTPPKTAGKATEKTSEQKSTIKSRIGKLSFGSATKREKYEALLPQYDDMKHQLAEGYQDYVDERVEEGERIDINTKQYRYIGYMTGLRKAIELVWNYPLEASRRGMQGEVLLEFHIQKDGKASHIRVVKSSGYEILDDAMVETIRLASPFSPLPEGFNKKRLVITGSFHYVLNTFGSH